MKDVEPEDPGEDGASAPDYSRNFVKAPRVVLRALRKDPTALAVYCICLDRARYAGTLKVSSSRGVADVEVGQCALGRDELAAECGATAARVRSALDRLMKLGVIAIRSTKRGTIVTLLGFKETYGRRGDGSPTEGADRAAASADSSPGGSPQSATNKTRARKPNPKGNEPPGRTLKNWGPDGWGSASTVE